MAGNGQEASSGSSYPHRSSSLVNVRATAGAVPPDSALSESRPRNLPGRRPSQFPAFQSPDSRTIYSRRWAYGEGDHEYARDVNADPQTMTSRDPRTLHQANSYPFHHDQMSQQQQQQQQQRYDQAYSQHRPTGQNYAQSYPFNPGQRPLIDLVTNEWQHNPKYTDHYSDYSDDDYEYASSEKDVWPGWVLALGRIRVPRRVQRWLLAYLLFLLFCWFGWLYWLRPAWEEERFFDDSLARATMKGNIFGTNIRPSFTDMVHLKHLDSRLIPGTSSDERRLVFVGDVHGCKEELLGLLDVVSFDNATDHLIFTGDLIAKGPDSPGVVDVARQYGSSCVRGNHEDRVLLAWNSMHSRASQSLLAYDEDSSRNDGNSTGEETLHHGDSKDRALASEFSPAQIRWLKACPVILRVGRISGMQAMFSGGSNSDGEVVVAHAGLIPGVDLERQDPFQAMNMRTIDLDSRVPSELRVGEPWDKIWNHHMNHLHPPNQRITVVYGHDAKRGLNVQRYSKGLDSNCVRGGRLTALVVDSKGRQKVFSVNCKKR